jgi:hypothetical protein
MSYPVTDPMAAQCLANGHPKSKPEPLGMDPSYPGLSRTGAAPGANGPPTTGPNETVSPMSVF